MKKLIFLSLAVGLWNCRKDSQEALVPECNTQNVSFSRDVLPVIERSCYTCHGNGQALGGVNLDGYQAISAQSKLYGSIAHLQGAYPMPPNGKLPQCEIDKIKAWIDASKPNN
jgi:cytochrome c5